MNAKTFTSPSIFLKCIHKTDIQWVNSFNYPFCFIFLQNSFFPIHHGLGAHFSNIAIPLLLLFLANSLVQRLTSKGPMIWPVMGIIPTVFFNANDIYNWGTEQLRRCWMMGVYGIMTNDSSNVAYMLKTKFHDLLGGSIFNADGELWKERRKAANLVMHSRQFVHHSFLTVSDLVHHKLLKLVEKFVNAGESINLQDLLLRFTFDNICITALGVSTGCLDDLSRVPFAKAFEKANEVTLFRFLIPPSVWKLMKFFDVGSEKKLKEAVQIVHEFAEKTVIDRRIECCKLGGLDDKFDLLSRLMVMDYQFSNNFLKDFCISFILAGRDTSSVAMSWFFWLIYKHPLVETRIVDEINEIISTRKSKTEHQDDIVFTFDEINKMEYLKAALSESLSFTPQVPVDLKEAQEDDVLPDGNAITKGYQVLYSIYAMALHEGLWGKDYREFKPERWMKDGRFESCDQFKYVVFNAGPRMCPGKKFAYMQMKMLVASFLLRYSVKVVNAQTVVQKMTTTLYMKNGLLLTFKPRRSHISKQDYYVS